MRIIARRTLREFWERHNQARLPLMAWYQTVAKANWQTPAEMKATFGAAVDIRPGNRAIFDVGGNKYRVVVVVKYAYGRVFIRFVGTHKEYDRIDVDTI